MTAIIKEHVTSHRPPFRSPAAIVSGISILTALPLAIITQSALGHGGNAVVHVLLALGIASLIVASGDFRMPAGLRWIGRTAMIALGLIFLLQGIAEALQWPALLSVAYEVLPIQIIEKSSVYPILLWFSGLMIFASGGKKQVLGTAILSTIFAAELISLFVWLTGGVPDPSFRAFYLLPFGWLILEGSGPGKDFRTVSAPRQDLMRSKPYLVPQPISAERNMS